MEDDTSDGNASAVSSGGQSYTISGVKVEFPYKAYPSQLSMMSKVIDSYPADHDFVIFYL